MKFIGSNSGPVIRGRTLADADFSVAAEVRETVLSSQSASEVTIDDAIYDRYVTANVRTEYQLNLTELISDTFGQGVTFVSLNEAIATVDANGYVSYVSDGTVTILVKAPFLTRPIIVTVSETGTTTVDTFNRWVVGSLAKEVSDAVDTRIATGQIPIFSIANHATPTYVRNVSCWAANLDLTAISPWNSAGQNRYAGTLISPRHIVFAEHYRIPVGATIRFILADNSVVTRTITARQDVGVPNSTSYASDICVGLLDSDVPAGIGFAKVLPSNVNDYFGTLSKGIPCLCLDQEEKAMVSDLYDLLAESARFKIPTDAMRLAFYESLISGDSGNPAFLIINGELVIVTTWTYGGAGSGPNYAANLTDINTAMTTLGGGYQLTEIDLSSYPSYA